MKLSLARLKIEALLSSFLHPKVESRRQQQPRDQNARKLCAGDGHHLHARAGEGPLCFRENPEMLIAFPNPSGANRYQQVVTANFAEVWCRPMQKSGRS